MVKRRAPTDEERIDLAIRLKHGLALPPGEHERQRRAPPVAPGLVDVDIRILRALNANARKSFRDIARELDLALSTVSNHVKKLEDEGFIEGYAPMIDPAKLGYDLVVIIGVKIKPGKLLDVQERIARSANVFGVYDTTGDWDSMMLARFRDRDELNRFIKELSNTADVERTTTQLVLNTVKEERRVLL